MTAKLLTIVLIVVALIGYQLSQRTMPSDLNPFTVIAVAYLLGIIACALLAPRVGRPIGLADAALLRQWQVWVLAASVVGIEVGYLLAYRAGWPLATATGITYASTMVLLALVGATWLSEAFTLRRALGLALAIGGVWLLVTPSRGSG